MPHHFHQSVAGFPACPAAPHSSMSSWPTEKGTCLVNRHMWAQIPPKAPFQNTLHVVTVSIPRCERGGAGANPAVGTISSFVRKAKSRAGGPQNRVTQCEPGAHVQFRAWSEPRRHLSHKQASGSIPAQPTFHRIRESQRTRLPWKQETPGAAPGYPTISLVCSLTVRASGS